MNLAEYKICSYDKYLRRQTLNYSTLGRISQYYIQYFYIILAMLEALSTKFEARNKSQS